jgi:opacity protein-like surface antigen
MRVRGIVAASIFLMLLGAPMSGVLAQDPPADPPAEPAAPDDDTQTPDAPEDAGEGDAEPVPATAAEAGTEEKKGMPFGLFVEIAVGTADADDINNSLRTLSTHLTDSIFTLEDQAYGRASIGWKMPNDRGNFRLTWTGYKEDGYKLRSRGLLSGLDPALGSSASVQNPLPWWFLDVDDGTLSATRLLPQWTVADDTLAVEELGIVAGNGAVDCPQAFPLTESGGMLVGPLCEARFLVGTTNTRQMADDMQNRTQTVDVTYGRRFGTRRFKSRWFAGARYWVYDGTIPTSAWVTSSFGGTGFTDGFGYALIPMRQENEAFGPTAMMSFDVNFFNDRLVLYVEGQAALMFYNHHVNTQEFFTLVSSSLPSSISLSAELDESRSKTSWQNSIEGGVRVNLKMGLQLHAAYNYSGFLDAILLPTELAIPRSQQSTQGVSAIYDTQDYRLASIRLGVGFQF